MCIEGVKTNQFIYSVLFLGIIVSVPIGYCKDLTATLEDGRKVLLKDNGTWEFISEEKEISSGEVLTLERFKMKYVPQDYESNRYSDEVRLILFVKNNNDKEIKDWKALMMVKNPFEEVLFTCNLTSGASNIKPGKIEKATFGWEDNPFIDGQPYDKLMPYSEENLKIELSDIKVIQQFSVAFPSRKTVLTAPQGLCTYKPETFAKSLFVP